MSTTISMTRDELLQQRQTLLDRTGMTYEQLREAALAYTLRPAERNAYETIRAIDYLLGDD